jgi:AcrR family transcriptional regulator
MFAGVATRNRQESATPPTRRYILSATAELFLGHGIANVSVEAIARSAGTSKPTLYQRFVSKDELVAEYVRESTRRIDACWAKIDAPHSTGALIQLDSLLAALSDGFTDGQLSGLTGPVL